MSNHDTREAQARRKRERGRALNPPQGTGLRALAKTCEKCGRLNTCPDKYLRIANKAMYAYCKPCERDYRNAKQRGADYLEYRRSKYDEREKQRALAHAKAVNAKTRDGAHKHRNVWTSAELAVAARADLSSTEVAERLGRTMMAVQNIRRKIKADPRKARLADQTTELADLAEPGVINIESRYET